MSARLSKTAQSLCMVAGSVASSRVPAELPWTPRTPTLDPENSYQVVARHTGVKSTSAKGDLSLFAVFPSNEKSVVSLGMTEEVLSIMQCTGLTIFSNMTAHATWKLGSLSTDTGE
jgi:hypothetical protein